MARSWFLRSTVVLVWLLGFTVALVACGLGGGGEAPSSVLGQGTTTATPTTGAGAGGDPLTIDDTCCLSGPQAPFQGPSWFAFGAPGAVPACPGATAEGLTVYHEMKVEPHTCGACACSPAACALPAGIHTNAAKCPGDGSFAVPFGPDPAAWMGMCSNEGALPANLQCNGALCVESVTVPAVGVAPCAPMTGPTEPPPEPTWARMARQCVIDPLSSEGCEEDQVCPPPAPEGFSLCLYAEEEPPACPADYPHRTVFYRNVTDERGCEACTCSAQSGAQCMAILQMFSDAACGTLAGAVVVSDQEEACVDVLAGSALASMEASMVIDDPGSCAPSGGAAFGEVLPADPVTLCCQATFEPPG